MDHSHANIVTLAKSILKHSEALQQYFDDKDLPQPSHAPDGPTSIQIPPSEPDVAATHLAVLAETRELQELLAGPTARLMSLNIEELIVLHAIYRFKVAEEVPLKGGISYEDLAVATGLNASDLRRILRFAITSHIFAETRPGFVAHTATSKLLAESQLIRDFLGLQVEEKFTSGAQTINALEKWNGPQKAHETGFSLARGIEKGVYADLSDHPERQRRWANAMSQFATRVPTKPITEGFDWASLPAGSTIVDVGGGHGPVTVSIAEKFPQLRFVVQDLPNVVSPRPEVPASVTDRIDFAPYDFTSGPQPKKDAAVYIFRAVFHNWPEGDCITILRNHLEVLKSGALLVICESLLPEPGELPAELERRKRSADISMLTFFGARERNEDDWKTLFAAAHPDLALKTIVKGEPGAMSLIVVQHKENAAN